MRTARLAIDRSIQLLTRTGWTQVRFPGGLEVVQKLEAARAVELDLPRGARAEILAIPFSRTPKAGQVRSARELALRLEQHQSPAQKVSLLAAYGHVSRA